MDEPQIDLIVREVLERLRQHAPEPLPAQSGELVLSDRVVTLRTVDGKLDGIRQVTVSKAAIVTPAARDEFAQREIACVRRDEAKAKSKVNQNAACCVVAATSAAQAQRASGLFDGNVAAVEAVTFVEAAEELCRRVAASSGWGVLFTDQPAAAVCLANRHSHIRAAHVVHPETARAITASIGANVFVIDRRGMGDAQVKRLIHAACEGRREPCPAELQAALGQAR
jgi:ribose 5-phosphate isomerase RpiB